MPLDQNHTSLSDTPDSELSAVIRSGAVSEQECTELYQRHRKVVRAYAGTCCRDPHTAEDLTSEAFTRTIDAVRRGGGPSGSWRPYLITVVRRTAIDWAMTGRRTELTEEVEAWADEDAGGEERVLRLEEADLVARSFRRLPERWQAVLWQTLVEGQPASRVAADLGLSESGVGSLAERAREGLREAYLSVHVENVSARTGPDGDACRHYSGLLAAAVRRPGRRVAKDLSRHLNDCADCRRVLLDLTDLNSRLRSVLPGAVLLWGGAGYLGAKATATEAAAYGVAAPPLPPDPTGGAAGPVLSAQKAGALAAAVSVTIGGYLLLAPDRDPAPPRAVEPPRASAPPVVTPSPSGSSGPPAPPATGARALREGPRTTLRVIGTGKCLEAGTEAKVREAACDGGADQVWSQLQFRGSAVLLRNAVSRLCLTDSGAGRAPDELQPCDGSEPGQVWRLEFSLAERSLVAVGRSGRAYAT
ncbi:sigma-70 family RNA polymerase sigma factor [Streptomyces sp. bgisy100]|uniref:sigma-70 family RNA polymerase sigma factor n=1 Tax=Streptomyces sp. bgisy100 TaxID=3413783 RepID=UPI003D707715